MGQFIRDQGFTLLELMVSMAIIGILAASAVPAYSNFRDRAKVGRIAADLKTFATGFSSFAVLSGDYPPDTHLVLPPGVEEFVPAGSWAEETPLGGNYNWEGPDSYPYAGISITDPTAEQDKFLMLDQVIDDGNFGSGRFRVTGNGRYTFIIEE